MLIVLVLGAVVLVASVPDKYRDEPIMKPMTNTEMEDPVQKEQLKFGASLRLADNRAPPPPYTSPIPVYTTSDADHRSFVLLCGPTLLCMLAHLLNW